MTHKLITCSAILLLVMGFTRLQAQTGNTFTDTRDGEVYKTITIGNQVWMAENLRYLPRVVGSATGSTTKPYYYVYNYNGKKVKEAKATDNFKQYGVLYNWNAAMKACPKGWHLPSDAEWATLMNYLGGDSLAGGKLKATGRRHWISATASTNESGFTGLGSGYRGRSGYFNDIYYYGYLWSATEHTTLDAWGWYLFCYNGTLNREYRTKEVGFCVRCLQD